MVNSNHWLSHSVNGTPLTLTMPIRTALGSVGCDLLWCGEKLNIYTGAMGSGGSKKNNLDVGYNPDRRPSQHELTNPPTESRGYYHVL